MKTMYTCKSGLNLIERGADCGCWNDALVEIGEAILQVDESAIKEENVQGEYVGYLVNSSLGNVQIIGTVTEKDIEYIMVDSKSKE
jgi:hypothetical protein